jgi:ATP/ADP translocase
MSTPNFFSNRARRVARDLFVSAGISCVAFFFFFFFFFLLLIHIARRAQHKRFLKERERERESEGFSWLVLVIRE